jgi:uncharacterized protein
MMEIHIDQLIDTELRLEFEEKPEKFPVLAEMIKKEEVDFPAPIKTRLRVFRIGDIIEVEGVLETAIRLTCGRCLGAFETQLVSEIALTYARENPQRQEDLSRSEIELSPEDAGLISFSGDKIDLRDGVQEQVVMVLPVQPLCREHCGGLCPQCGANLNNGKCGCRKDSSNTQFSVLKKLKL